MGESIIALDQSEFDNAINNLNTIYNDLVSRQNTMKSVTENLFDGWKGQASETANKIMTEIDKNLNTNIENFLSLKNTLSLARADFNTCDFKLSNKISEKMNSYQ